MRRRQFLGKSAAGLGVSSVLSETISIAGSTEDVFIACDADRLTRVLVHTPGPEIRKILAFDDGSGSDSMLGLDLIEDEVTEQHRLFTALLRGDGIEVVEFTVVLDEAIEQARRAGRFESWLKRHAPRLVDHARSLDASVLVGGNDAFVYGSKAPSREFRPLVAPLRFLFFTRDLAVMTPRGIVLPHIVTSYRAFEARLSEFVFRWSPSLNRYPIRFDAAVEGVELQGGDLIVADERTLLLGVNNLSQEEAAPKLARALGMNVVAVDLLGLERPRDRRHGSPQWSPLRTTFLHLDSVFSLVARGVGLATPYFLEERYAGADPLTEVLRGVSQRSGSSRHSLEHMARALRKIGRVRFFQAGTGELDPGVEGMKLVDFLRERGFRIHFVGGNAPAEGDVEHFVESVHRELRFQAANVLATRPGRVIAPAGNSATEASLRGAGIEVITFPAGGLVRWHGGPHCLSLPLERTWHS